MTTIQELRATLIEAANQLETSRLYINGFLLRMGLQHDFSKAQVPLSNALKLVDALEAEQVRVLPDGTWVTNQKLTAEECGEPAAPSDEFIKDFGKELAKMSWGTKFATPKASNDKN